MASLDSPEGTEDKIIVKLVNSKEVVNKWLFRLL